MQKNLDIQFYAMNIYVYVCICSCHELILFNSLSSRQEFFFQEADTVVEWMQKNPDIQFKEGGKVVTTVPMNLNFCDLSNV